MELAAMIHAKQFAMPQLCQRSSRPSLPKPPAGMVTVHVAPQGSAVISSCTRSIVRR
jgi:hypothetical protein